MPRSEKESREGNKKCDIVTKLSQKCHTDIDIEIDTDTEKRKCKEKPK